MSDEELLTEAQASSIDELILNVAFSSAAVLTNGDRFTPMNHMCSILKRVFGPFIERTDAQWERILSDAVGRLVAKGLITYQPEREN
jgi:hypothetical protein